jgi:hypothetical protein
VADTDVFSPPDATPEPVPRPRQASSLINIGGLAYDIYSIRTAYRTVSGRLQVPAAGPDPTPARIVRVHAPYTLKVVTWEIQTVCPLGTKPLFPHWNTNDSGELLYYGHIEIQAPVLAPGGNAFIWYGVGEYQYVRTSASTTYPTGTTPISIVTAGNFTIDESNFSTLLLDATTPAVDPVPPLMNARF